MAWIRPSVRQDVSPLMHSQRTTLFSHMGATREVPEALRVVL